MSSQNDITITHIEQALETFPDKFSLDQLKKKLGNSSDGLSRRLERLLDGDERFFNIPGKDYQRRESYFRDFKFAVTFDDWELSQGFLIPGHRFAPYFHSEVFPSEMTLISEGREIPRKEITLPLGQAFHYHMLLGSDNVFDYLLADSPANSGLRYSRSANEQVTLNVFDFSEFFARHKAVEGDALSCRVTDYTGGVCEITYLPGSERSGARRKEWVQKFDEALTEVCSRFEDYPDITEQLAWGLFYGGKALNAPDAGLDEYIRLSLKMTIRADGDHAVLALREDPAGADSYETDPSDVLSLSRGETGSLAGILKDLGNPVTLPEIDACILDECFARESDFDAIFRRIFGPAEMICADEMQQACLYNYLEERFEELHDNYNRVDDELKAPLRAEILEGVDAKLEFFRLLAETNASPEDLEKEKLHRLAEIDLKLDEMLKLLNSIEYTPDQTELDKISERVENLLDEQQDLIEDLTLKIESH